MAKIKSEPKAEESKVEEVKPVEPVEVKPKQFKNNSEKGIKIKLVKGRNISWLTIKPGDIVTIPEKLAKANKLEEVE